MHHTPPCVSGGGSLAFSVSRGWLTGLQCERGWGWLTGLQCEQGVTAGLQCEQGVALWSSV